MKKWIGLKTIAIVFCCHFIVGCATSVTPTPGSEKIKIIGSAQNRCKKLGEVNTNDVSQKSFDSAAVLHDMNTTFLKNKALALGANVIVLTDHTFSQKTELMRLGKSGARSMQVNKHEMTGIAYYCPNNR